VVCLLALGIPLLLSFRPYALEERVRALAQPYEFNLVAWEATQLRERLPSLLGDLRASPRSGDAALAAPADAATVQQFFAAVDQWRQAREAGAPADTLAAHRVAWEDQRAAAAAVIAQALNAQAAGLGLTTASAFGSLLLPPASFEVSAPPRVLVVSPRDRVEVAQSVLLRPDVTQADAEALEQAVDGLGLSGLVVTIGGIATYPAIVPLQGSPLETLSAVAHEWLHGYLFFQPLGQAYFASYDGRMLNETVADLGGRELGRRLAESLGLPASAPSPAPTDDARSGFDFRREMRATRLQLDALLAEGRVAEAEQYLHARRQDFVAAGYAIRKLNQAYFAFHGSYGESPAAVSPLDRQVRALRAASPDLGAFLRRVARMSSSAEVAAAIREPDAGS
jgi:hypothetical protein